MPIPDGPWRVATMPVYELQDWLNQQHPSITLYDIHIEGGKCVVIWKKVMP